MDAEARKAFFMRYLPGLLSLTVLYILLTAYRDFRDNFAVEIWKALGKNEQESAASWRVPSCRSPLVYSWSSLSSCSSKTTGRRLPFM